MQKKKKHSAKKKTGSTKKKKTAKKSVRRAVKKSEKKSIAKKRAAPKKATAAKPAGVVTHFFSAISVAIIKCKTPIAVGDTLNYKGATTDFKEAVKSMQYDHKPVMKAKKGQEVGVKVKSRVREGDKTYLVR